MNYTCPDDGSELCFVEDMFICMKCDKEINPWADDEDDEVRTISRPVMNKYLFDPYMVTIDGMNYFFINERVANEFAEEFKEGLRDRISLFTGANSDEEDADLEEIEIEPVDFYLSAEDAINDLIEEA